MQKYSFFFLLICNVIFSKGANTVEGSCKKPTDGSRKRYYSAEGDIVTINWQGIKEHIRTARRRKNPSCRFECLACSMVENRYVKSGNIHLLERHSLSKKHQDAIAKLFLDKEMQAAHTELNGEVPPDVDARTRLERAVKRARTQASKEYDQELEKAQKKEKIVTDQVAKFRELRRRFNPSLHLFDCIPCALRYDQYIYTGNRQVVECHLKSETHEQAVQAVREDPLFVKAVQGLASETLAAVEALELSENGAGAAS